MTNPHSPSPQVNGKPNTFIVGQPKSGTSALYSFLRQHPQVCVGATKEPQYFCDDLRSQYFSLSKLERNQRNYLSLYSPAAHEKVILDGSTAYLYSQVAADNIRSFFSPAKIIMIFRRPLDYLVSYHRQLLRNSCLFEVETDFNRAIALESERKKNRAIPSGCFDVRFLYYSDRIQYATQYERYAKIFPPEQLKVLIYEEMANDNKTAYKDVVDFLGIDSSYEPEFEVVNQSVDVRSRKVKQFFDRRLFGVKNTLKSRNNGLYRELRRVYRKAMFRPSREVRVSAETAQFIADHCKNEVERLSELLGKDLAQVWSPAREGSV